MAISIRRVNILAIPLVSRLNYYATGCGHADLCPRANDPESRLPAGLLDIGVSKGKSPSSVKRTCQMLMSPQREVIA